MGSRSSMLVRLNYSCFVFLLVAYTNIESENHRAMESGRNISALNLLDLQKILLSFSSIVIDNYLLLNVYVNWVSVSEITKLEPSLLFHDIFKSSMMKCKKFLLLHLENSQKCLYLEYGFQ